MPFASNFHVMRPLLDALFAPPPGGGLEGGVCGKGLVLVEASCPALPVTCTHASHGVPYCTAGPSSTCRTAGSSRSCRTCCAAPPRTVTCSRYVCMHVLAAFLHACKCSWWVFQVSWFRLLRVLRVPTWGRAHACVRACALRARACVLGFKVSASGFGRLLV